MRSQLEITDTLQSIAFSVSGEGIPLVIGLRDKVYESLRFRPYNEKTKELEHQIRWKRTADQIFKDGYVYEGKACSDIVVAYLGLAKAREFTTQFVEVYNDRNVHSIAEIFVDNKWYIYNVASRQPNPQEGQYRLGEPLNGWYLWKKGRDAWDLGLMERRDIRKIKQGINSRNIT